MMKKLRNRKGEIATGFTAILTAIVVAIGGAGLLYDGGTASTVGSTFFLTAVGGSGLATQLDASVDPFREKKAIELCEQSGGSQCEAMIQSWSKQDILGYIKDDEPAVVNANGGNFVNGEMNG